MLRARLYKPSKTSMQSGKAKTKLWLLEFFSPPIFFKDEMTGWTGSTNTLTQTKLQFKTVDEALQYAQYHKIELCVDEPKQPVLVPKTYSNNFRFDRII
jgi:hypothetical protein